MVTDAEEASGEVEEFEVDISVPKPPSFGSSTKVSIFTVSHAVRS